VKTVSVRDLIGMHELAVHDFGQTLVFDTSGTGDIDIIPIVQDAIQRRPDLAAKALALAIKIEVAKDREA
jgi:hypothetical protein